MNIGTPLAILSIIYIESIHKDRRLKNDIKRIIFSAVSREKIIHKAQLRILPPSSDVRGIRLKIDKQRDRIENGNKKLWQKGSDILENAKLKVKANPKIPAKGPPSAKIISSTYDNSCLVFIRAPSREISKRCILIFNTSAHKRWPDSCKMTAHINGMINGVFAIIKKAIHIMLTSDIFIFFIKISFC